MVRMHRERNRGHYGCTAMRKLRPTAGRGAPTTNTGEGDNAANKGIAARPTFLERPSSEGRTARTIDGAQSQKRLVAVVAAKP